MGLLQELRELELFRGGRRGSLERQRQRISAELVGVVSSISVFASLSRDQLTQLLLEFSEKTTTPGSVIVREGESGDLLYVLAEGDAVVTKQAKFVAHLDAPNYFGESALLSGEPRKATVIAGTRGAKLLTLSRERFLRRHTVDKEKFKQRVKDCSLFSRLQPEQIDQLWPRMEAISLRPGETFVEQGQIGSNVYVIVQGDVTGGRDHCGEQALLRRPNAESVTALTPVTCVKLHVDAFYPDFSHLLRRLLKLEDAQDSKKIGWRTKLYWLVKSMIYARRNSLFNKLKTRDPEVLAAHSQLQSCDWWSPADAKFLKLDTLRALTVVHDDFCYVVISGLVRLRKTTEEPVDTRSCGPGDVFWNDGHVAITATQCDLFVIDRRRDSATLGPKMNALRRFFQDWDDDRLRRLAFATTQRSYSKGKVLLEQSATSRHLIFIVNGRAALLCKRQTTEDATYYPRVIDDPLGIPRIYDHKPDYLQRPSPKLLLQVPRRVVKLATVGDGAVVGESALFVEEEMCAVVVESAELVALEVAIVDAMASFDKTDLEELANLRRMRLQWRTQRLQSLSSP